ncbi:hypothetical protein [Granulosicoccus antarcticus]|uniref:Uncharacterized protein n=1 Tax=Granulosicoccus antarcticus IMCC3135 TaxID=1192854 RepID=A0A2Z2NWU3_9GAMM|nr:hypothetical protein [Granulosicoccus antarcticus]ASJ74218.1 hypothetical protein IMCC3135_20705 [Granulosicoccus antarcticus IMCC3135]
MAFGTLLAGNAVLLDTDIRHGGFRVRNRGGNNYAAPGARDNAVKTPVELSDTYGLWHRSWLQTPSVYDNSTHVMWMQAAELHVDMRLPEGVREMESASSLAALNSSQLRLLAAADGFAGKTSVTDSICTWSRRINFQGPLKGMDVGELKQTTEGLLETGLYANYNELWQHVDNEKPQERLLSDNHGRTIVILWTETQFALGRGWSGRIDHNRSLREHVDFALGRQDQAALARAFDQEFCFGQIEDGRGIVEHSTQPMRRGTSVFDATELFSGAASIEFSLVDFFGESTKVKFKSSRR